MTELTAEAAAAEILEDEHRRALAALKEEQRKTVAVKERAKKQQARLDKAVALAVSSRPRSDGWALYPGPLNEAEVRGALGLSVDDLVAMMKRFGRRAS